MLSCPICGSKKHNSFFKLCTNMKIMGDSFSDCDADIASCLDCGAVYLYSSASQNEYHKYYISDISKPVYYSRMFGTEHTQKYFEHILNVVKPYVNPNSRILDVGSGICELALYMKNRGFDDYTVLDPKDVCIEYAKENNVAVIESSSTDMTSFSGEKKFDFIICNHILEHICDLKTSMNNIWNALADNGRVFIEIPDAEKYSEYADEIPPYSYFTYEHVIHFGLVDFQNFLNVTGFKIIDSGEYYKDVSSYPCIWAVAEKSEFKNTLQKSNTAEFAAEYISKCKFKISRIISELVKSKRKLILWGIGASTAVMLDNFSECEVIGLVDGNPKRQGLSYTIGNRTLVVKDPNSISDEEAAIFIMSGPYKDSIANQIRNMKLKNEIISFD